MIKALLEAKGETMAEQKKMLKNNNVKREREKKLNASTKMEGAASKLCRL